MNEKVAIIKLEREYCGSFDFKSRAREAFKVENVLTSGTGAGVETNERRVGNVEQERGKVVILSVTRGGKVASGDMLERKEVEEIVKSESVRIAKCENEAKKGRKYAEEKMEVDSGWTLKSREEGVMVWVKEEEAAFKQEVVRPKKPAVQAKGKEGESSNCDDLVWCGELVWHESTSILPLVNSCPCTVTGRREVVGMLPTRLAMRLISMRAVQAIQPELLRRCHRLELVPCRQEGSEQTLAKALSTMAGIVNQGDQLAMLLLHSKAKGVIFGFVFQDRVDFSTLGSSATARKQEAARRKNIIQSCAEKVKEPHRFRPGPLALAATRRFPVPSERKKTTPPSPTPRAPKPTRGASPVNVSPPNPQPGPLALEATRRFPVRGSSLTSLRNCPIAEAEEASRPPSTTLPVANANSQLRSVVSSPKARMVSNYERSQLSTKGLINGMMSSPKARMVSAHEDAQQTNPGVVATRALPNLTFSCIGPANDSSQHYGTVSSPTTGMVSNQDSIQRLSPSLVATRTPPSLALSSRNISKSPITLPMLVRGQKSSSNNHQALNLLKSLDKRRKSAVLSKVRCREPSVDWDFTASPSKINMAKPHKCIICCRPFKHEYSLQLHRQRAHSIVRKLKCLKCDQTFETMHNLKVHTMTAHKKSNEEFSCGSDFRLKKCFKVSKDSIHSQSMTRVEEVPNLVNTDFSPSTILT